HTSWQPYPKYGRNLHVEHVRWDNGLELEVFRVGKGAPVLLLPPINCDAWVWWPVAQRLASSNSVYLVNLPGHGGAAPFSGELTPRLIARAVTSLRELVTPSSSWSVCGWSFGGLIAQAMLQLDPRGVRRVVLVNTTASFDITDLDGLSSLFRKLKADLDPKLETRADPLLREFVYGGQTLAPLASFATSLSEWDLRSDDMPNTPALLVSALDDAVTPPYMMYELHDRLPASELTFISRGGHYWPLFAPDDFVRAYESWLANADLQPRRANGAADEEGSS
ncbi:MAG TPA: alpha/beta fold hydrolase, partial [Polyangiales bacterium]